MPARSQAGALRLDERYLPIDMANLWMEDTELDALADAREDGYGQSKWSRKLVWEAPGAGCR